MKIAMVFDGLGFGGIERVGLNYATMLVEMGHEVTIVNLKPKQNAMASSFPRECMVRSKRFNLLFQPDAYLVAIKKWWWGKYAYPLANAVARPLLWCRSLLARVLQREKHDVAIAFSGHVNDLTYVSYGLVKSKSQLAWLHGSLADYLLLSYAYGFLYERISNLCVLSTNGQVYALQAFSRLQGRLNIRRIYNPIAQEPEEVDPEKVARLRREYDEPLVMVGRFGDDKDQPTVIRAVKVLRDGYGIRKHALFVGDGPTQKACKELAHEIGVDDIVHFVGAKRDVDNYFLAASVAVHSSPSEGLPTVLLEAMRDGVPVVATNSLPGVPEILGAEDAGLICEVGSPEAMAGKLYAILTDVGLRSRNIERGKLRAADFSPVVIKHQLEEILRDV